MKLCIVGIAFILKVLADDSEKSVPTAKRRYEYKQSFKKPFKIGADVPGFVTLDGATVTDHFIRLSSSIRARVARYGQQSLINMQSGR
ncbi:hypothetical protein DSO57_1031005 [Entomophthora muscae]|uniref:Uncharacterized protein n=1 Tax=Entomophthora muscae TaxID=34485 RepID=A0ACC2SQ48_9FUNG|nr:hypothetical protein DSO57_1031005 [Entomophthora muscae]